MKLCWNIKRLGGQLQRKMVVFGVRMKEKILETARRSSNSDFVSMRS